MATPGWTPHSRRLGRIAATARRSSASVGSGGDPESLERPSDAAALAVASHAAAAALAVHGAAAEGLRRGGGTDDLNGAEEGGRPGLGGGGGAARAAEPPRGSMLRRVAPVMAVSCAAGIANYGLCVPAYAFAELLAEASGYPNLPTMVNVVYYVATPSGSGWPGGARPRGVPDRVRVVGARHRLRAVDGGVGRSGAAAGGGGGNTRMDAAAGVGSGLGLLTGGAAGDGGGGDGDDDGVSDPMDALKARGLLVAVAVFALCNPYTISEGFRWCQSLHMGERPARWVALALQGGSAVGAIVASCSSDPRERSLNFTGVLTFSTYTSHPSSESDLTPRESPLPPLFSAPNSRQRRPRARPRPTSTPARSPRPAIHDPTAQDAGETPIAPEPTLA